MISRSFGRGARWVLVHVRVFERGRLAYHDVYITPTWDGGCRIPRGPAYLGTLAEAGREARRLASLLPCAIPCRHEGCAQARAYEASP